MNKKFISPINIIVLFFSIFGLFHIIKNNLSHYSGLGYWAKGPSMNNSVYLNGAVTLKDGNVLVIGDNTAEIYDSKKNKFIKTNKPIINRNLSPLLVPIKDGKVLIFGGTDITKNKKIVEVFDSNTKQYKIIGKTVLPHYKPSTTFQNKLLNYGTVSSDKEFGFELFDPDTSKSKLCTIKKGSIDKTFSLFDMGIIEANNKIIISGGFLYDGTVVNGRAWKISGTISEFSPQTCTLKTIGHLVVPRVWHSNILLPDGKILIVGGVDNTGKDMLGREIYDNNIIDTYHFGYETFKAYIREIELLDPKTGESKVVGKLNYAIGGIPALNILQNRYILLHGKGKQAEIIDIKDFKTYPAGKPKKTITYSAAKIDENRVIYIGETIWHRSAVNIFHFTKRN